MTAARTWRKSSRSNNNGGSCVEVAALGEVIAIRDSKLDITVPCPILVISKMEWHGLTSVISESF